MYLLTLLMLTKTSNNTCQRKKKKLIMDKNLTLFSELNPIQLLHPQLLWFLNRNVSLEELLQLRFLKSLAYSQRTE